MLAEVCTLLILTVLETALNLDNLIFISLEIDKVTITLKERVRFIGLGLALVARFVMLFFTSRVLLVQEPILRTVLLSISPKDLLMIIGGLFLTVKSFIELWSKVFLYNRKTEVKIRIKFQLLSVVLQIVLIDLIFSFDSLLTAIVLTHNVMTIAMAYALSMLFTIILSNYIVRSFKTSPGLKIITILFILFVGAYLILEGLHIKVPKEYLYFSLIFALLVEVIRKQKA